MNPCVPEGRGEWRIHRSEWNSENSGIPTVSFIRLPPAAAADAEAAPVAAAAEAEAAAPIIPHLVAPAMLITPAVLADITSSDPELVNAAFGVLQRIGTDSHVAEFMNTHLIYNMHTYINAGPDTYRFRALWVLTNVTSKNSEAGTRFVFRHPGLLQSIVNRLIGTAVPEQNVLTQALWCLGNIAGSGHVYAEQINSYGLQYCIAKALNSQEKDLVQNAAFLMSNLARHMNRNQAAVMMRAIADTDFDTITDPYALCDFLIAVDRLYNVMENMYFAQPSQISLLLQNHPALSVRKYVLTVIGSVLSSDNRKLIDDMIGSQVIQCLYEFLVSDNFVNEVLWTLSNCAADIKCSDLIANNLPLLNLIYDHVPRSLDATYAVANLVTNGSSLVLYKVIDSNGFALLVDALDKMKTHDKSNTRKYLIILEGIEKVLIRAPTYVSVKEIIPRLRTLIADIDGEVANLDVLAMAARCAALLGDIVTAPPEKEEATAEATPALSILSSYVPSPTVKTAIANIRKNKEERWVSAADLLFSAADVAYMLSAGYAFHISGCIGCSDACLRLCGPK